MRPLSRVLSAAALITLAACGSKEPEGSGGAGTGASSSSSSGSPSSDPAQACVDDINAYRATLGLAPYERWTQQEACASSEAEKDGASGTPHSAFGACGESAQNECPGWPGPPEKMIGGCLDMMWAEGPGSDFSQHGHYINMSSTTYTKVACGFHVESDGSVWAAQDFR
jgi:hypothetical protein